MLSLYDGILTSYKNGLKNTKNENLLNNFFNIGTLQNFNDEELLIDTDIVNITNDLIKIAENENNQNILSAIEENNHWDITKNVISGTYIDIKNELKSRMG